MVTGNFGFNLFDIYAGNTKLKYLKSALQSAIDRGFVDPMSPSLLPMSQLGAAHGTKEARGQVENSEFDPQHSWQVLF